MRCRAVTLTWNGRPFDGNRFAADLKAGDLATQISMLGRPGRDKSLEIGLVDPAGRRAGGYYVMTGLDANQELARVLPIDNSGRIVIGPHPTRAHRMKNSRPNFSRCNSKLRVRLERRPR